MSGMDGVNQIVIAAQLAAMLEVSGWPKPGNVHRTADLSDTRYEHFLASAAALGSAVRKVAMQGVKAGKGNIKVSEIGLGKYMKQMISDIKSWHRGGNTHLGVSLLFIPLAAAAGKTYAETGKISARRLHKNVKRIMRLSTPCDATEVYDAILMVSTKQELGQVNGGVAPDLYDKDAKKRLLKDKTSLYDAMVTASSWDTLADEWVTGMKISFEVGYPTFLEVFRNVGDINAATVHTFLMILSKFPDTFIARKVGLKETADIKKGVEIGRRKTRWISERAGSILKLGGLTTKKGREALGEFDRVLQEARGKLNPGTTADLTAATLMIALLCGFRF